MEPPLVSTQDLAYRVGRQFDDSELNHVEALIDDVSALVRDEAGTTWIDPETGQVAGVPASVRAVVLRVAERVVTNPDNLRQESSGDYSYSYRDASLDLTASDRRIIRRAMGRTGLWTQPVERDGDCGTTLWAEDSYGCELFPLTAEGD